MKLERELMRGAGPLAVMHLLGQREMYGYEMVQELERRTAGVLAMGQSTLYPMLYNLEAQGLLASRVERREGKRKRKYYHLTDRGKNRLQTDAEQWAALTSAMGALGV